MQQLQKYMVSMNCVTTKWFDMQQLHGFDELRNDSGVIQNRSAGIDKAFVLF
jgi:hypothetical protein